MSHLVRYEAAKKAIAEYKTVDDVKDFRDKAVAIEAYAKQANDDELEKDAASARVRAERKCGELLRDMEKAKGTDHGGRTDLDGRRALPSNPPKTLSEMGLTKDQSSKWQKLAAVPEDEFEEGMNRCRQSGTKPTATVFIPKKQKPPARMHPNALFWWGELNCLKNDGRYDLSISEVIEEMTPVMREDFISNLPKLKQWLES